MISFSSTFLDELPIDSEHGPRRRSVAGACASRVSPSPVGKPELLAWSREMAEELGLGDSQLRETVDVWAGNRLLSGMQPYAACYGGHQFGNWAGQLGDGRAITLGETRGQSGQRWELQLKGAGPTPYSRSADGRAVLRSSVREFLCSEAMYHLGVPTTRALCLVGTGDGVIRDMFYDGRPELEPGAIVCRVAPSFLRFGNFEILASRDDLGTLAQLVDYALRHFFPELRPSEGPPDPQAVVALFERICQLTAQLVVEWMRVGFVHGVMNTDNMSILGLTIDYGPYGWLEDFDPTWTPNTTDAAGRRYRYGAQPRVAGWNLLQLANALLPLAPGPQPLEDALERFLVRLQELEQRMWLGKLGLHASLPDEDGTLLTLLQDLLPKVETDMTWFFRQLGQVSIGREFEGQSVVARRAPLESAYYAPDARSEQYLLSLDAFLLQLARRAESDLAMTGRSAEARRGEMNRNNPRFVLRNYLAQLAIDAAAAGEPGEIAELLEVLRRPYEEQSGKERHAEKRPEWARQRAGCSMLSCSS